MADQTPDSKTTPQPVSLRDDTPSTPPQVSSGTNGWMIMTVLLGVTLLVVLIIALSSAGGDGLSANEVRNIVGTEVAALRPTNTPIPPTPTIIPVEHYADDDAFLGAEDAKVIIVEFSDFQCGYCGRWYETTLPQILEAYPDDVKFIYRDFPIFGEPSIMAAMAAECAEEQDPAMYWEMHNRLFDRLNNQDDVPLDADTLAGYADDMGLDVDDFETCLDDERYLDEITNDFRAAEAYQLRGTPGFVINGVVYAIGAQPFEIFDGLIKAELARLEAGE